MFYRACFERRKEREVWNKREKRKENRAIACGFVDRLLLRHQMTCSNECNHPVQSGWRRALQPTTDHTAHRDIIKRRLRRWYQLRGKISTCTTV